MPSVKLTHGDDVADALDRLPVDSELLLPRGTVFETSRTPTIRRDGTRISTYGDDAGAPPVIRSRGCGGLYASGRRRISVSGVRFECAGTPVAQGVRFINVRDVELLELDVTGFTFGIAVQGYQGGTCADVAIRRCHIHDNWHPERKHSSGIYAATTERLVIEHNVFDTNGWRPGKTAATMYNHNCYLQSNNGPAVVRGNVFVNAAAHGLQQRCGGVCEGNVFLDNPIHQSYGLINGAAGFPGGVSGAIRGNVYAGSRDIAGSARGWAIELANILSADVSDLLIAHDRQGIFAAILVSVPQQPENPDKLVGIVDLEIESSVHVWDWPKGAFSKSSAILPSGTGMKKLGRLVTPKTWSPPPVKADLRKIVNLSAVRELARRAPAARARIASDLISACRAACGLAPSPEPVPPSVPPSVPPAPSVRLVLWRDGVAVNDDVRDGAVVDDGCGLVAQIVSGTATAVRFFLNGTLAHEERYAPFSIGGDDGAGKVRPFDFPQGPFLLAVELLDGARVAARREVSLFSEPSGSPPTPPVPDVPGAVAAALEARGLLPTDPHGALAHVERVIDLLT